MLITPIAITVNSMYLFWHLKVTRYQYVAETQVVAMTTLATSVIMAADGVCLVMFGMRIGTMEKSMPLLPNTKNMIVAER